MRPLRYLIRPGLVTLLPLLLTACAVLHPVPLPEDGIGFVDVLAGDRVQISTYEGRQVSGIVQIVKVSGLVVNDEFIGFADMLSLKAQQPVDAPADPLIVLALVSVLLLALAANGAAWNEFQWLGCGMFGCSE